MSSVGLPMRTSKKKSSIKQKKEKNILYMTEIVIYAVVFLYYNQTKGEMQKMKTKIICKQNRHGTLDFYVQIGGGQYFLFCQDYKRSVKDYFSGGVDVHAIGNYAAARGEAVRKTLDKLPAYLRYVEKEFSLSVLQKTKQKQYKKTAPYKRQNLRLQEYLLSV